MSLASLYSICLQRIYGLLKEGMWKLCITNPFSELPTQDVNKLMEMTLLHPYRDPPKISDVILLLTSGRLTRIDLQPFRPKIEQDLIVKVTQIRSSTSMRNFASHSKELFAFYLVRNIISWNPYLEEFHSSIHPGFDVFRNCQNLRILKIYAKIPSSYKFLVNNELSFLSSLRNLEVLHLFCVDTGTIANVLEICPKLISIGEHDSLDSMNWIHQRRLKNSMLNFDVGSNLELRRCFWGNDVRYESPQIRRVYESNFCDYLRFAITLCPLVQELIFNARVKEAIKQLRFLKQLTLLRIDFDECEGDFVSDFVALLQEMGPQLKHLSIAWKENIFIFEGNEGVPVDVICDCCPHLESLKMELVGLEPIFSSRVYRNLSLKRLTLESCEPDEESLLFLLSNCKHLEELFIIDVEYFDDALLSQIFQRNPFTELKLIFIAQCGLTREGYQMFMEKAASIQTILVSNREKYFYDVNRSFKDPNLHYLENAYFYVKRKEFFYCRLNKKRF